MKEFLYKYVYITILKDGKKLYYTCAYITNVSDTHISFIDKLHDDEPFFYKIENVDECKLSNKVDSDGNVMIKDRRGSNGW